jgi:hypothetical protein
MEQRSRSQQTVLGSIPNEYGSVAQKLSVTEEWHQDQRTRLACLGEKTTGTKAATLKILS